MDNKYNVKRLALSVSSALIGAVLAFLLGEVFLRIYQHVDPVFVFPDRSYNRFRGKPFADDYNFKLNWKGLSLQPVVYRTTTEGLLKSLKTWAIPLQPWRNRASVTSFNLFRIIPIKPALLLQLTLY